MFRSYGNVKYGDFSLLRKYKFTASNVAFKCWVKYLLIIFSYKGIEMIPFICQLDKCSVNPSLLDDFRRFFGSYGWSGILGALPFNNFPSHPTKVGNLMVTKTVLLKPNLWSTLFSIFSFVHVAMQPLGNFSVLYERYPVRMVSCGSNFLKGKKWWTYVIQIWGIDLGHITKVPLWAC